MNTQKLRKMKDKIDQNLYYFTYGLFLFGFVAIGETYLLNLRIPNLLYKCVRMFTAASMLYLTVLNFWKYKDRKYILQKFCVFFVMSVILLLSYRQSKIQVFLVWFLLTVPAEGKSVKKIIDTAWIAVGMAVSFAMLMCMAGVIPNVVSNKGVSMGFWHANTLGAFGSMLACLWMVKRYQNFSYYDVGMIAAITLVIYFITGCKTTVFSVAFMLVLVALFKAGEKNEKVKWCAKWLVRLLLPACIALSFAMGYLYNGESVFMTLLNKVLSGRFRLAHQFLERYPVTLLGQNVLIDIPLDNMYVRAWLESGVLVFVMVWSLYYITMNKLFERKEYGPTIACCVYTLYGISEACVYLAGFNFTMLFVAQLFPVRLKEKYKLPLLHNKNIFSASCLKI